MAYPPFVYYQSELDYKCHYERVYCKGAIITHDGVAVRFRKKGFRHIFFESTQRNTIKDEFSVARAERIDWIRSALMDSSLVAFVGWNKKKGDMMQVAG